jgi:hypothetical protein
VFQIQKNSAVNNLTYLRRLTSNGNIACKKKVSEKMLPNIQISTDRLTNPYNTWAGLKIPIMRRIYDYIVLYILEWIKQPATRSSLQVRSPKLIIRHKNFRTGDRPKHGNAGATEES